MKRLAWIAVLFCLGAPVVAGEAPEARSLVMTGTVTDPEGRPVQARLWAIPHRDRESLTDDFPPPSATVQKDGTFAISDLPPGQGVKIYSCAEGFLPEMLEVHYPEEPVRMTLRPAATVRGQVLAPDGSPRAGADVWVFQEGVELGCVVELSPCLVRHTATADAEGRFELSPLRPGWYTVWAGAQGFVNAPAGRVRAGAGEIVNGVTARLQNGVVVTGRVVNSEGRPVAGARINAFNGRSAPEGVTAADGSYRLDGVDQGQITIAAELDGYQRNERAVRVGKDGARAADLVLLREEWQEVAPEPVRAQLRGFTEVVEDSTFAPVHEVSGRVVDAEGLPVAGVHVNVLRGGKPTVQSVSTRADGTFALSLVDGLFGLKARKPGYATSRLVKPFQVAGGPVDGLEIRLERSATVHGRILGLEPGEIPVVLASAKDRGLQAEHDLDGGFTISDLEPGSWTITAYLKTGGDRRREIHHVLTVLPGVFEIELDLDFTP